MTPGATGGGPLTLAEAAEAAGGRILGDGSVTFNRIAPIHDALSDDLAFLADRRYAKELEDCGGSALLVSEILSELPGGPADRLVVEDPYSALLCLLPRLYPPPPPVPGIHPSAVIDPSAVLGTDALIGPNAVVGARCRIGDGVKIGAGTVVGEDATLGDGVALHPNVTIYPGCQLGKRVIIHSGTRLGVDGFGYVTANGQHTKLPQVGGCVVEDDVEIGANCTIDRGSIGRTVIGEGSKLDNLVHLGHNVLVGPHSIIVAQVGVAGSTRMGPGVVLGGQAGLTGHLTVGAGARIGAQAGVIGDVAPGEVISGYPARDHKTYLRAMAALMRLPDTLRRIARLEASVDEAAEDP